MIPRLAAALLLIAGPAAARDISGPAQVKDGDSLIISAREIRLSGIDAPEARQKCRDQRGEWPCGAEATSHLKTLAEGRALSCAVEGRDSYGRVLATCYLDGRNLNEMLVLAGWAVAYRRYSEHYVEAEAQAQAARRGIWRGEFEAPEDWRHRQK